EDATGMSGAVVQGGSPRELAGKLKKDEVQLGVFQGVEYAWARTFNDKLVPLVICVNQARTLKAYLIVRAAWQGSKVSDLEGTSLILPAERREHCRAFLDYKCVSGDKAPTKFYSAIKTAEDVEEALDEVCDGNATATVVDGLPWSAFGKAKPGRAKKL